MMTTSRRAVLAGIAALPAVSIPAVVRAAEPGLEDDSPAAALARAEQTVSILRTEYVGKPWLADADDCERVLGYFRRAAAAGKWPDGDNPPDEQFAIQFFGRHNVSLDWIFRGNPLAFIIHAAARSKQAEAMSAGDDPIFALIEQHRAAEQRHSDACLVSGNMALSDPRYSEAEARATEASDNAFDAAAELTDTRPTTMTGLKALLRYVADTDAVDGTGTTWPVGLTCPSIKNSFGKPLTMAFHAWLVRNVLDTLESGIA